MDDTKTLSNMDVIPERFGKGRVIKNLVVMSLALMLSFTAYVGLSMLQSTMNKEHNIGTISQAAVYIAFCLSSLTLPKYAVRKLGCKIVYLISTILFLPYLVANIYPSWATMIPSAILLGIASTMVWAAQTNYFNACVIFYCSEDGSYAKEETVQHPATICDRPFTETLSSNNFKATDVDLLSGDNSNLTCAEVHSEKYSNCRCLSIPNQNSECLTEETPSDGLCDCSFVLSENNSKCMCLDVPSSDSNYKAVEISINNAGCLKEEIQPKSNSKRPCVFSGEESINICSETYSKKNSEHRENEFLPVNDSKHSKIEICAENGYKYEINDKHQMVNSGCNSLKTHSIDQNICVVENFASTENLLATHFDETIPDSFITKSSKRQVRGEFSMTNPNFMDEDDNYKNLNSKNDTHYSFASNIISNHTSKYLNHGHFESPFVTKTFKGEITPDVSEVRSRYTHKQKLTVSITPDSEDNHYVPKSVDRDHSNPKHELEAHSELKVEDLESLHTHIGTTDVVNNGRDIQCGQEMHRKSLEGAEVKRNIKLTESVTARFFGCNGLSLQSAQIWSNLVSYYVLQDFAVSNSSMCSYSCGAAYCNTEPDCTEENSAEERINDQMRYLLIGIYVIIAILSILLVLFFLDPLPGYDKQPVKFSFHTLMATYNHCKKGVQICLIPMSLYMGMIQGFYTADFTKSYIACALGHSHIGLVTVSYGLACALSSTLAGYLVKFTGRIIIFLLMQVANLAVNTILLMWIPDSTIPLMFYLAAVLLGVVTGILSSQIPAFYSILFKKDKEAAFASYYVFNSIGWLLSFLYTNYMCTSIKIYVLITVSSLGILGYLVAERIYTARNNKLRLIVT